MNQIQSYPELEAELKAYIEQDRKKREKMHEASKLKLKAVRVFHEGPPAMRVEAPISRPYPRLYGDDNLPALNLLLFNAPPNVRLWHFWDMFRSKHIYVQHVSLSKRTERSGSARVYCKTLHDSFRIQVECREGLLVIGNRKIRAALAHKNNYFNRAKTPFDNLPRALTENILKNLPQFEDQVNLLKTSGLLASHLSMCRRELIISEENRDLSGPIVPIPPLNFWHFLRPTNAPSILTKIILNDPIRCKNLSIDIMGPLLHGETNHLLTIIDLSAITIAEGVLKNLSTIAPNLETFILGNTTGHIDKELSESCCNLKKLTTFGVCNNSNFTSRLFKLCPRLAVQHIMLDNCFKLHLEHLKEVIILNLFHSFKYFIIIPFFLLPQFLIGNTTMRTLSLKNCRQVQTSCQLVEILNHLPMTSLSDLSLIYDPEQFPADSVLWNVSFSDNVTIDTMCKLTLNGLYYAFCPENISSLLSVTNLTHLDLCSNILFLTLYLFNC